MHEWGLVRGNLADHVVLSGPRRAPIPIPLAKPVLYFHRHGEGPLAVDVEVRLASGRMVEHWPLVAGAAGPTLAWRGVDVLEGACGASRYPEATEAPCLGMSGPDGCEAAELATVETADAACLSYGGASLHHLFYRGELTSLPEPPLEVVALGTGASAGERQRVTSRRPIVGALVRVRGTSASVVRPAALGEAVELELPQGALGEGAEALAAALSEAGLSDDEVAAFRRAWDATLFPAATASAGEVVTATPMAGGLMMPRTRDALLYVLSAEDAERFATLTFTPAPTAVRRAIVVWLDLVSTHPAYEPPY